MTAVAFQGGFVTARRRARREGAAGEEQAAGDAQPGATGCFADMHFGHTCQENHGIHMRIRACTLRPVQDAPPVFPPFLGLSRAGRGAPLISEANVISKQGKRHPSRASRKGLAWAQLHRQLLSPAPGLTPLFQLFSTHQALPPSAYSCGSFSSFSFDLISLKSARRLLLFPSALHGL